MTGQARGTTMTRDEVLTLLRAHKATLSKRFGVTELALFGSFARDQNAGKSDVDILVRFDRPATPDTYFGTPSSISKTCSASRSTWLPTRRCAWSCAPTWNGRPSVCDGDKGARACERVDIVK